MPDSPFTFADLFAGVGGFHAALHHAGGRCVYVSEIDDAARAVYVNNWVKPLPPDQRPRINTDINLDTAEGAPVDVPPHDVLTAGFPCQPFSKSGAQRGMDETRGTLFWNIARVLQERRPPVIVLENVRNLAGPRHAHEWDTIIRTLRQIGYRVSSRPAVFSPHLLPPSSGGTPQVRHRVFICGTYIGPERTAAELAAGREPDPVVNPVAVDGWNPASWRTEWILDEEPTAARYRLSAEEVRWIDVWDDLVQRLHARGVTLPGFPLWSDSWVLESDLGDLSALPRWKAGFLLRNARFYERNKLTIDAWRKDHPELVEFPATRRKLEWQAQGARSLWDTLLQMRPSGIRAKAATYLPALVAITQTSIYGPGRRRLTPHETARLQGLPRSFDFGGQPDAASYRQTGNSVAVGAVWHVLRSHVLRDAADLPDRLVRAVTSAPSHLVSDALSPAAFDPSPGSDALDLQTSILAS
ncbi:DNA (cytosine-5-)-methyltransferase [Desertihabitans brevis]|uniref:Cytosine-specific methyltransferase n=1 Tax=Desertihabitans brevis TaxID=2268447 RepID=A0A367YYS1_9ACTN|nr:DNA (cytosine-5-)-methyltransferase [Desertihabitans brevis]RCK70162.1 DNA (cytosine-5-)-methyltransferase [Desertihabitans brevis]